MKKITLFIILASQFALAQQYVNGNVITGTVTQSGVVAPAGYSWAEAQNDAGNLTISNYNRADYFTGAMANDFVIPAGQTWNINSAELFIAQLTANQVLRFGKMYIEIWNGDPSLSSSTKIYGDQVTNTIDLPNSLPQNIYVIGNTNFTFPCGQSQNSFYLIRAWKVKCNFNVSLPAGTYWIVFNGTRPTNAENPNGEQVYWFASRDIGSRGIIINSPPKFKEATSSTWVVPFDEGCPAPTLPYRLQEFPFNINYTTNMGLDDVFSPNFKIYPNPATDIVNIQWDSYSDNTFVNKLVLTDIRGIKVMEKTIGNPSISNVDIATAPLQNGIYLLNIFDDKNNILKTSKIVKQ